MSWIHCNNCFDRGNKSNEILFSQCGHLLCSKCFFNKCPLCHKVTQCIALPLKEPNSYIGSYFQNPIKSGNHLLSVLKFQFQHRVHQEVEGAKITQKVKRTNEAIEKVEQKIKKVEEEMKKDYLRIKKMKMYVEQAQMYKSARVPKREKGRSSDSGIHLQTSLNSFM